MHASPGMLDYRNWVLTCWKVTALCGCKKLLQRNECTNHMIRAPSAFPHLSYAIEASGVITINVTQILQNGCLWYMNTWIILTVLTLKTESKREAQWSAIDVLPVAPSNEGGIEVGLLLILLTPWPEVFIKTPVIPLEHNLFCCLSVSQHVYI